MPLHFTWHRLDQFSVTELYEVLRVREEVFVVEQQCPYQEIDGLDAQSWHLRMYADGQLAGYVRVVEPGLKYPQPSIGRVLILPAFRRHKLGQALMTEAIAFTEQTYPGQGIQIGAQARLAAFYGALGFEPVGAPYDEDGIPHLDMLKPA